MTMLGICIVFLVVEGDADGYGLLEACVARIARHTRGR